MEPHTQLQEAAAGPWVSSTALKIVLQHDSTLACDLKSLRSILMTCKTWNTGLSHEAIPSSRSEPDLISKVNLLQYLLMWQRLHPERTQSSELTINRAEWQTLPAYQWCWPTLVSTILVASWRGPQAARFKASLLQNQLLHIPNVLLVLPVQVTQLVLSRVFEDPHIAGIADLSNTLIYALSHLTALQANSLGSAAVNAARAHTVQQYLHALSAIPSLTSLELTRAPISAAAAALLPAHIHSLVLDVCRLPMGMSLAHMPALQALDMVGATPPRVLSPPDIAAAAASAILPPSLTALNVLTVKLGNHCLNLAELTALQHLFSQDSREDAAWLSQLQLPLLTHLSLRYLHRGPLMDAAAHWANLPKLQSLELSRVQMHSHNLLNDLTSCVWQQQLP